MPDEASDWEDVTPGEEFTNWTRLPYTFTYPPKWFTDLSRRGIDPATLRTTPLKSDSQWSVDDGEVFCSGEGSHMWLQYDRPLRDFEFHVEWRFHEVEPDYGYNSGVFVRNDPVANRFYQIETGATKQTAGFPFTKTFIDGEKTPIYGEMPVDGELVEFHPRRLDIPDLINPPGEWNTYDVVVEGSTIELRTNGEFNGVFEDVAVDRGHIGLEAEGYPISFRNVRLNVLE